MEGGIQSRQLAASIGPDHSWKIGAWKAYTCLFIHVEIAEYVSHDQSPISFVFPVRRTETKVPLLYADNYWPPT